MIDASDALAFSMQATKGVRGLGVSDRHGRCRVDALPAGWLLHRCARWFRAT